MKLEDQVCSLELSKRLKELGVKQESYFSWIESFGGYAKLVHSHAELERSGDILISAFTVAELGEMLPPYIDKDEKTYWRNFNIKFMSYMTRDGNYDDLCPTQRGDTEADTRALMLIHLLENKLMELPK